MPREGCPERLCEKFNSHLFSVMLKVFPLVPFLDRKTRDNDRIDSLLLALKKLDYTVLHYNE